MKLLQIGLAISMVLALAACGEAGTAATSSAPAASGPKPSATATSAVTASASATAAPEEIAAQHVLIAYKGAKDAPKTVKRTKDEAKKLAEEIRVKAAGGADFGELAKTQSDDPGSKERLGSLGKFKRTEMVPAVSDAAFGLKVDEVSAVVESPFGFHIIKRNQ